MGEDWQGVPLGTDKGTGNKPETHETFGTGVPHSGDLGLEAPVTEFDKTSLQEAHDGGALTAPDSPATLLEHMPPLTHEKPSHKKALFAFGAAAVAAVGGLLFLGNNDQETKRNPSVTTAAATDNSTPSTSTETTSTQGSSQTTAPETSNEQFSDGVFNVMKMVPGDNTVTATRLNGDIITIPTLRDNPEENPNGYAASALALISCYLSTADENCLDEISPSQEVRDVVEGFRIDVASPLFTIPENRDGQEIIRGNEETPAQFTYHYDDDLGLGVVELTGGRLHLTSYLNALPEDNEWYAPAALSAIPLMDIESITFYFDPDNPDQLEGLRYNAIPNPDIDW